MAETSPREKMTVRVIREGQAELQDTDWFGYSAEERIEAVWTLTKLCLAWKEYLTGEPRLQRTATRLQRPQR
jgi:hypothetical protein